MATGIIAKMSGAGTTLNYTPTSNAKVIALMYTNTGAGYVTANGLVVGTCSGGNTLPTYIPIWVGAGQTVSFTISGSVPICLISAVEEQS